MRAGVVSDIHGSYQHLLRALAAMGDIDLLLHAGDGCREIARWRAEHRPARTQVVMVAGNCDLYPDCPPEAAFEIEGRPVLLTHGHLYGVKTGLTRLIVRARQAGTTIAIFGHTHVALQAEHFGVTLFNPGSLSGARSTGGPSYGLIEAKDGGLRIGIHYLS